MNFKKLLKLIFTAFAAQASAQTYTTKCASTAAQYDGPKGTYASLDYAKFCMHSNQAGNGVEGTFKNETAVLKPGIRRDLEVTRKIVAHAEDIKEVKAPAAKI